MDTVGLDVFEALKMNLEGQVPRLFCAVVGRKPNINACDARKCPQHPPRMFSDCFAPAIGGPFIMQFYKYGSDNHVGMIALVYECGEKVDGPVHDVAVGVAGRVRDQPACKVHRGGASTHQYLGLPLVRVHLVDFAN